MRFSTAYYLLLLYLTVMLKPLMPLMCDAWDHAFAEANHIATIHARYGANHAEKAVATGEQNDTNKNQNTTKTNETVPVHVAGEEPAGHIAVLEMTVPYPVLTSSIPPMIVPATPGQPPKYVL